MNDKIILSKFIFKNKTEHVHLNCPECKKAYFVSSRYMSLTTEIIDNSSYGNISKNRSKRLTRIRNKEAIDKYSHREFDDQLKFVLAKED